MSETVSLKAYARLRGCSPTAVRKAIERLGILRDSSGKIVVAEADRLWPRAEGAPDVGTRREPRGEPGREPAHQPSDPLGERVTYAEARRRKEIALARLRELEAAEREGQFIPLDMHEERVQALAERMAAACRNLQHWAGEVCRAETESEAIALLERISDGIFEELLAHADALEIEADEGDHGDSSIR